MLQKGQVSRQGKVMGKHCFCVSVLKSHIKPETDNAQRPTQV